MRFLVQNVGCLFLEKCIFTVTPHMFYLNTAKNKVLYCIYICHRKFVLFQVVGEFVEFDEIL